MESMGFGCLETPLENFMCADYIWKVAETHSRIFFWGEAITKVIDGVAFAKAFLKNVGSAISAKIRGSDCNCINRGPFEGKGHCAVLSSKSLTFEATEVKEIIKIEE